MTEENYKYRTSQLMLRSQFPRDGKWKIPIIPRARFRDEEFHELRLIGFDRTKLENVNHLDRMVHFFLYDYKFERVWKNPDADIEKLSRYRAVLSPDFSIYLEMHPLMQLYNTFRNRWCGAYFAGKGMRVVPTVNWGDESTFGFCFKGIPKGSTVAVSTYMAMSRDGKKDQKEWFMKGYKEMLRQLEPERILCYSDPFPEMEGNIIFIDYALNSWKFQNDDPQAAPRPNGREFSPFEEPKPSKYFRYFSGEDELPPDSGVLVKQGHVVDKEESEPLFQDCGIIKKTGFVKKGGGSAYDPADLSEERLEGSEIKGIDYADLPDYVKAAYDRYERNGWKGNFPGQSSGTKAGKNYRNNGLQGEMLPAINSDGNEITYREFDVNNKIEGQERDGERFVKDLLIKVK